MALEVRKHKIQDLVNLSNSNDPFIAGAAKEELRRRSALVDNDTSTLLDKDLSIPYSNYREPSTGNNIGYAPNINYNPEPNIIPPNIIPPSTTVNSTPFSGTPLMSAKNVSTPPSNKPYDVNSLYPQTLSSNRKASDGNFRFYNYPGKKKEPDVQRNPSVLPYATSAVLSSVGPLTYLFREGEKYDRVKYGDINPSLQDPHEELMQQSLENAGVKYDLKRVAGSNAGLYIAGRQQAAVDNMMRKSKIIRDYGNVNANILNRAKEFNKSNEIRAKEQTAANKGKAKSNFYQALYDVSGNLQNSIKDYRMDKEQVGNINYINHILQNYEYDNKGNLVLKNKK